jgi:hypothetical protein
MADYSSDNPMNGQGAELADRVDQIRDFADEAKDKAENLLQRGKELVTRYPAYSVAGAVAAGWLFAKFVSRRR